MIHREFVRKVTKDEMLDILNTDFTGKYVKVNFEGDIDMFYLLRDFEIYINKNKNRLILDGCDESKSTVNINLNNIRLIEYEDIIEENKIKIRYKSAQKVEVLVLE